MMTTRLSNLTLLHVFRDIEVDLPCAIDEFARSYPRRLQMSDILSRGVGNRGAWGAEAPPEILKNFLRKKFKEKNKEHT